MRLKEYFWMIGIKPKIKEYGAKKLAVDLSKEGHIEYAQWLHPKSFKYIPTQEEIDELRKFVSPGDVCIDIGGYIGDTAIPMALAVGKTGCVLALEPNKYVFKILAVNAGLIKEKGNIIPLQFAVTPEEEEMEFNYSDYGFGNGGLHENISKWKHGHAFKLKVQGKNLVKYLEQNYPELIPKIKFIKIDTEGYDLTVLQTLSSLIKTVKPFIRTEVFRYTDIDYRKKVFAFFKEHGYQSFYFNSIIDYQGKLLTEEDVINGGHFDIFARPL